MYYLKAGVGVKCRKEYTIVLTLLRGGANSISKGFDQRARIFAQFAISKGP